MESLDNSFTLPTDFRYMKASPHKRRWSANITGLAQCLPPRFPSFFQHHSNLACHYSPWWACHMNPMASPRP